MTTQYICIYIILLYEGRKTVEKRKKKFTIFFSPPKMFTQSWQKCQVVFYYYIIFASFYIFIHLFFSFSCFTFSFILIHMNQHFIFIYFDGIVYKLNRFAFYLWTFEHLRMFCECHCSFNRSNKLFEYNQTFK